MSGEKVTLKEVITDKMNELENMFIRQEHLDEKFVPIIEDRMAWISKMWRIVSDDDKEWIEMAQFAMEDKLPWK